MDTKHGNYWMLGLWEHKKAQSMLLKVMKYVMHESIMHTEKLALREKWLLNQQNN